MKYTFLLLVIVIVTGLVADIGGPDTYGYYWSDDAEPDVTFDWAAPDTAIAAEAIFATSDDDRVAIPLPFPVNYYDTTYSGNIIVTTNGVAGFDMTEIEEYSNTGIPAVSSPNNALYIYWDDLQQQDSSHVYYQTDGAAPNRILTITWFNWFRRLYYSDPEDPLFFQIRIFETSGSDANDILFQYLDPSMSDLSYTNGGNATIGIEDASGTIGLQYSYNTTSLDSGRAIRFWRPATSNHDCAVTGIIEPGGDIITGWAHDIVAVLRNVGSEDEAIVPVFLNIVSSTGDTVHSDSDTTAMLAGAYDTLTFSGWTPADADSYTIICEVDIASDTMDFNDRAHKDVIAWEHISRGGPDVGGYMWFDSYDVSGPAYIAPPIDDGITIPELEGDDRYFRIGLPFTFTFYDVDFDSIWISTNGWISFDSTMSSSYTSNDSIPADYGPDALLAIYWDDSDVDVSADSTASVRSYYEASTSSFWVIWNRIQIPYSATTSPITYAARLFMDGTIEYHYLDAHADNDPDHDYGLSATVGIENLDGTDGLMYEYNGMPFGNPLFDHFAIRFVPPWTGPDTIGPIFAHNPPDSAYADIPEFCLELEVQIRDYNTVENAEIHVGYPFTEVGTPDTIIGDMFYFTICDLQPWDSVSYHFEADDSLDNHSVSTDYNIWILNPHQGGPDITGYKFVDSWAEWDTMAPEYGWFELNPDSGGAGTEIIFGFSGISEPIPFSQFVPFYGIESGGVIVSEDGWLMLDTSASSAPAAIPPVTFPSPDQPNAVIAPLWTDLEPEYSGLIGGKVFYSEVLDDSMDASYFVVQWDLYETGTASPDLMRFQAKIYYDNDIFGSRIEFVYRNIEDFNKDEAGICIEHETGYDGLAYLYLGAPIGAPVPVSEMSILFYNSELDDVAELKLPEKLGLSVYPNPFNSTVAIDIRGIMQTARLEIFDINGHKIKNYDLTESTRIVWRGDDTDGRQLPSGVYLARFATEEIVLTEKLILIK